MNIWYIVVGVLAGIGAGVVTHGLISTAVHLTRHPVPEKADDVSAENEPEKNEGK